MTCARIPRQRLAALMLLGASLFAADRAAAADLFHTPRHRAARRVDRLAIFPGDAACPHDEPAVYRPRILNFREPLCYAARPYGLSQHLYDVSADILIDRGD